MTKQKALPWRLIGVFAEEDSPAFAYTYGLTRLYDHPEVIVFGLGEIQGMGHFLNEIGERVAQGERFEHGSRKRGLLEGVTCAFARFPRAAHAEYLGAGMRELGVERIDAVQCIWPDRRGRLPWDPRVTRDLLAMEPVFLRPDAPSRDPRWRFEQAPSQRVLTTRQVVRGDEPVRFIGRFSDGQFQFVCETTSSERDLVITTLGWIVDHDPSVARAATLAPGAGLVRDGADARWRRARDWSGE